MKKSQYCPTIILTGLIFLSYSSVILAQSSENPYITDRGLLELRNVLNDSLSEIAKENRYTLHEDYTYLGIPESNIIITFSGGIISGIALGIGILGSPISPEVFATVVTLVSLVAVMSNFYSPGTIEIANINGMIIAFVRFIPKPSSLASSVLAIANTLILTLRLSEPFNINNPKFNPNPNRLEVHYKVTSDILSQDQIESSCFVFLSRRGDYIDGEVDECVWEGIFPQNVPGYLRIGDMFDKSMGQDMVVARFSIYDPIHP